MTQCKIIAQLSADSDFILILTGDSPVSFGMLALERFVQVALDVDAPLVYSDHFDLLEGKLNRHPVIDYQAGSLRDDFEFGPVLLFKRQMFLAAAKKMQGELKHAALYQLRLELSQRALPVRIQELLYAVQPLDSRTSGEKIFDYVDPRNREVQVEMEQVSHPSPAKKWVLTWSQIFPCVEFDSGGVSCGSIGDYSGAQSGKDHFRCHRLCYGTKNLI